MTVDFKNLPKISKTNVLGVLEFSSAMLIAFTSLPPGAKAGVIALALARAAIRFAQTDADRLPPGVPGNPTGNAIDASPVPVSDLKP